MSHRCFDPMELAALHDVPVADPRRGEIAACPRCDSLFRSLTTFLTGDDGLPAAERVRAEEHLARVLAGAITGGQAPLVVDAARPPRTVRGPAGRRVPSRRGWGWGLGLAAVAAGVVFFAVREPVAPAGPSGVLRGGAPAAATTNDLAITVAVAPEQGRLSLSWPAVAGAASYRLELFTSELDTVAMFDQLAEPTVTIDAALLGNAGHQSDEPEGILYRIRARGTAGQIAVSPLKTLDHP